jgi:hypothetical protein
VEIAPDGVPSMPDPADPDTFKQGMNGYHSAKIGLYSDRSGESHTLLLGGISLQYYDQSAGAFVNDYLLPFINQNTAIVIGPDGRYEQHLLSEEFPALFDDDGNRLRFGANAEFMLAEGVPTYDDGETIRMDLLTGPTVLGYVYGGIFSTSGNFGRTGASNTVFEIIYTPVPEPSAAFVLAATCAGFIAIRRCCRRVSGS